MLYGDNLQSMQSNSRGGDTDWRVDLQSIGLVLAAPAPSGIGGTLANIDETGANSIEYDIPRGRPTNLFYDPSASGDG